MALKAIVSSLDEVDENYRALYQESAGKYILSVEGVEQHPNTQGLVNALERQKGDRKAAEDERARLKEALEAYNGLDPEVARTAMEKMTQLENKNLLDKGEYDQLLEKQTAAIKANYEKQLLAKDEMFSQAQESNTMLDTRLREVTINSALKDAATKLGVKPTALADVVSRAKGIWTLDDNGSPIARDADGTNILSEKGSDPMDIGEWVEGLTKSAGHLFEPNSGGGAKGSGTTSSGGRKVVSLNDAGHHLEAIASGEAVVG